MPLRRSLGLEPVLTIHVRGRSMIPAVAAAVGAAAGQLGLDSDDANRATAVMIGLAEAVCAADFDDPDTAEFDVAVAAGAGAVVLTVEDRGLPFTDVAAVPAGADALAWADVARVRHDDEGHHVELEIRSRRAPVAGDEAVADEDADEGGARNDEVTDDEAPLPDGEVEVRAMQPGDEEAVARLIWRVYGYTYVASYLYHPDRVRHLREQGWLHAAVALLDGEIVGLDALVIEHPDEKVADWTLAATDPRARGRHILGAVGEQSGRDAAELGIVGTIAEAVTEHTITQRSAVETGAAESAVLFGFIPEGMRYRGFAAAPSTSRQSAVLSYRPLQPAEARTVHLPERYAAEIRRVYAEAGLPRIEAPGEEPSGPTRLHVEVEGPRNLATIEVERCGEDAVEVIAQHTRHALATGAELVYCELPLADPGTPAVAEGIRPHGYFWGGLVPEVRGDLLRMQYVEFEPDLDIIELYTDQARRLVRYQLDDRA